jgi:uncharacterized membrane protein
MGWSRAPIAPVGFAPREAASSPDAHAASAIASDAASAPRAAQESFNFGIRIFVCRDREHHKR